MKAQTTPIPGLLVLEPTRYGDERGFFLESHNPDTLFDLGIEIDFPRDNHSASSKKGTVRGLHYQSPPFAQAKIVRVSKGSVFDVAVDIRKGSPTYGDWFGVNLSFDNGLMLFIPEGFAHGFMTLVDNTEVQYKLSKAYAPESDYQIIWNDSELTIDWPETDSEPILSNKDSQAPSFRELDSPFVWDKNNVLSNPIKPKQHRKYQSIRWALTDASKDTAQFLDGLQSLLESKIIELEGAKPNSSLRLESWEQDKKHLVEVSALVRKLRLIIPKKREDLTEEIIAETTSLLSLYKQKISEWPMENANEVTDGIMRVSLVGICAGVGLIFGVPIWGAGIGMAMFGGEKIGKAISSAIKGGNS
jgi:dTDP-4-dehydrorhamnose 3,5-epimerase